MALWRLDIFASKGDVQPLRTGYANANSEAEAVEIATRAMGDELRADMVLVRATDVPNFPVGQVLWLS